MNEWHTVLEQEQNGEPGSFNFELCAGTGWDKRRFHQVFNAMRSACTALDQHEEIPRWIAELFWYFDWRVGSMVDLLWDGRENAPDYYQNAVVNLNHLAWWLFVGVGRNDDEFEPMDDDGDEGS